MKTLNITFTDAEHKKLQKAKQKHNKEHKTRRGWREFFLIMGKGASVRYDLK